MHLTLDVLAVDIICMANIMRCHVNKNTYVDLLNFSVVLLLIGFMVIMLASCGRPEGLVVAGCVKSDDTIGSTINGVCQ